MKINRLTIFAALLFAAAPLFSQTTARLTGIVTERSTGTPLANVTVTATSPALQGARTATSGADGEFEMASLPPGEYRVTFALPQFISIRHDVRLVLGETTRLPVAMFVTTPETLTVSGTAPAVTSATVATNFTLREIERLPVQRNQLATAQMAPGVTANVLANGELQLSGGPGYDNLALVNGVVVNENTRGQLRPLYVEDAIAETTIMTGAISSEYGRFTGGVISTITKSGGNEFSGSVRDTLSNPRWSAATPANETREDNLNHVFEATLGGFALRDRLWFFLAGRQAKNDTSRQTVAVPAFSGTPASAASTAISYSEANDQRRDEEKLTGELAQNHTLVVSHFGISTRTKNSRTGNVYDTASFMRQNNPDALLVGHYSGLLAPNVLAEAQYSRRTMGLNSGSTATDLINGTVVLDRANANTRANAPSLCAVCGTEHRDNRDYLAKVSWFLSGMRGGSHSIVAGADRFEEQHTPNAHQSGSDFSVFATRIQYKDGQLYPVFTPTTAAGGNTFIRWTPVNGAPDANDLRTDSLFLNDDWTLDPHWSFGLGLRYDRNHAADTDGRVVSDDRRISPRLSAHYDLRGDGRLRVNASFAHYVSRITDSIASAAQTSGNASVIDFAYRGPAINDKALTVSMPDALARLFDYFNTTQGGTANLAATNLRTSGSRLVPGYAATFDGTLASPYVREVTFGAGTRFFTDGYARIDFVRRDWRDFYAAEVNAATPHVTTPLGLAVDVPVYRNSNHLVRNYRGIQLQARDRLASVDLGLDYTYAKMRGNDDGETAAGPVANSDPTLFYPELLNYTRFAPTGWLQGDQRHRLRAWAAYDFRQLTVSVLQTYDSGLAYSAVGPINVTRYTGAPTGLPYSGAPSGQYFFSDRGAFRTDDITSTNFAVRYALPIGRAEIFLQGDLLNAFNRQGIADPTRINTSVQTAATSSTFATFNPFTETPVAGVHYQLAPNFGRPLNEQAYQTPRTYRVSVGTRF